MDPQCPSVVTFLETHIVKEIDFKLSVCIHMTWETSLFAGDGQSTAYADYSCF